MKILVVGLKPYDSGKTTLCKALIYGFKKAGIDFIPFKPHSGIKRARAKNPRFLSINS
jgi:predicted P-loop ATPase/GTPase